MSIRDKFKTNFKGIVDAAYDPATGKIKVDQIALPQNLNPGSTTDSQKINQLTENESESSLTE